MDRDVLGRLVREVWVAWAREQPAPKASWLVPWDGLGEADREVDRRIGEALARAGAVAEREACAALVDDHLGSAVRARNGAANDASYGEAPWSAVERYDAAVDALSACAAAIRARKDGAQ